MIRKQLLVATLLLTLAFAGCAKNPIHPGTANRFDSNAADALMVADSTIIDAKADIKSGTLPTSAIPIANQVIKAYDTARAAWLTYHDAALAGSDATALQATLQTDLDALAQAIASYKTVKGPQ